MAFSVSIIKKKNKREESIGPCSYAWPFSDFSGFEPFSTNKERISEVVVGGSGGCARLNRGEAEEGTSEGFTREESSSFV